MAESTADILNSLGEKIDSLDLTDSERALLQRVLARAAASEAEVEGFANIVVVDLERLRGDTARTLARGSFHNLGDGT
ncbi:MAG: hypothetical protein ACR2OD_08875 [Gaiellaceae bacterium]